MRKTFDRRVVPHSVLDFVRACQERVPCHLGGGAALAGAYLGHRTTGDIDLFVHDAEDMRALVGLLPSAAADTGIEVTLLRDVGHLVRARLTDRDGNSIEADIVHEPVADIAAPPPPVEGIVIESLADLRASKLTCILSRSEPRDLVDLYFLDQAGFPPERDLELALRKDAGIDAGVLAWLLAQFPTRPLPAMLEPLTVEQLERFRADLADRLRRSAVK
jgi:nucleotidyltransferase AbiEii toxin of type IV toxin-antitoxin system